jgi:hypothetical protein
MKYQIKCVFQTHDTYALVPTAFPHDLIAHLGPLGNTIAQKSGVTWLADGVINTGKMVSKLKVCKRIYF